MDELNKQLQDSKDPLVEQAKELALQLAEKYNPGHIRNLRIEFHVDIDKKSVIMCMLLHNL